MGLEGGSRGWGEVSLSVPEQGDGSQDAHGGDEGCPAVERPIREQHSPPRASDSKTHAAGTVGIAKLTDGDVLPVPGFTVDHSVIKGLWARLPRCSLARAPPGCAAL